ncbi:DUF1501 domain-containing protein [Ohtaekwangia sp.]|uniref:DUF1501 domain-containing protein n=1 Tax=Ohtaekwangia sp. TaxID=2066019 RepID=UPI002FDCE664
MNKSRRDFLKKLPLAMSIPFTIEGITMRVMGQDNTLTKLAAAAGSTDRVLIILQMHGGNDGLNCCIPIAKYAEYYSKRANIAIPAANSLRKYVPLDSTLDENAQIGLHPDMIAMKTLYDQGRMTIVQGVSYKNNNGSHFRGRDIQFMGGSYSDYFQSGWLGRYLQGEYAPDRYPEDFPTADMKDPLAIEIGNDESLIFHQEGNIPTSFTLSEDGLDDLTNLEGFFENQSTDPRGIPPEYLKDSYYYKELKWILDLEDKTQSYTERLIALLKNSQPTTVTYPESYPFNAPSGSLRNPLQKQLKLVARLLSTECKTRVFLVKIGGFDTHADQVEKYDPTMGSHAALMYHVATSMKAFQEDLRARGIEDRALTVTTSEFSRRVTSNASYGTDHGTAGPLFIFGKGARPGVIGDAFATNGSNLVMQYDYRNVYANIMRDWMGVSDTQLDKIFPYSDDDASKGGLMTTSTSDGTRFEALPLAQQTITGNEGFIGDRFALEDCYPNPAKDKTTVHFRVNSAYHVTINLYTSEGKKIKPMVDGVYTPGEHTVEVDLTGLPVGTYVYELKTGFYKEAKKLVITK